jgi:hypothetical protein
VRRRRLHRATFAAAGAYNIVWGCYAVLDPQWFFRVTGLPLSNTPQIFATLGMVLGLSGVLYLEVARVPERGWLIAAVGMTGKILGPLGLLWLILTHTWPISTVVLIATNDLLWWIPFTLTCTTPGPRTSAAPARRTSHPFPDTKASGREETSPKSGAVAR